jgi:flagellin
MVIQNNLQARNAHNRLNINVIGTKKSSEKLSSGFRINRAGDDAAGLAVSEKMRTQMRGLSQAIRNTNDGISFIQTAEGALEETQSMLKRLKELAAQSANGTYTTDDRSFMQQEVEALKAEIDRIAETTDFNGIRMLNGSMKSSGMGVTPATFSDDEIHVIYSSHGVNTTPRDGVAPNTSWENHPLMGNRDLTPLLNYVVADSVPRAVNSLMAAFPVFQFFSGSNIEMGLEIRPIGGASMAVEMSRMGNSLGVTLLINPTYLNGTTGGQPRLVETSPGVWNLNTDAAVRADFNAIIAHEMMHAFMAVATNNGMLNNSGDGFPMWFVEGMAQAAGAGGGWARSLGLNASSTDAQIQAVLSSPANSLSSNSTASWYGTGYLAVMYLGHMAGNGNIQGGINRIMGQLMLGSSLDDIIAENTKYNGLVQFNNGFAFDSDAHSFVRTLMGQIAGGGGSLLSLNLSDADPFTGTGGHNAPHTFLRINPAGAARSWNAYTGGNTVGNGGGSFRTGVPIVPGMALPGITPALEGGGAGGSLSDLSLGDGIMLQIGDRNGSHTRVNIVIEDMTTTGLLIDSLDISTQTAAINALGLLGANSAREVQGVNTATNRGTIDHAIFLVSQQRADLGALQNRLEHTASSLTATHENIMATESQIRDTDMAFEMLKYTKYNILQQAAQAMLAQANQSPQGVLQLLR